MHVFDHERLDVYVASIDSSLSPTTSSSTCLEDAATWPTQLHRAATSVLVQMVRRTRESGTGTIPERK